MKPLIVTRLLFGTAVVFFMAVPAILLTAYFTQSKPTNDVVTPGESRTVVLGRIAAGNAVTHTFFIRNSDSQPRHVRDVSTSCSCTVASKLPPILDPGRSYPLTLSANPDNRSGPWLFRAVILIDERPPTEVAVEADLVHRLPAEVNMGRQLRGSGTTTRLDVLPLVAGEHLKIQGIDFDRRYFRIEEGVKAPGLDTEPSIGISLQPDAPTDGGFDKLVVVRFEGKQEDRSVIRVTGWIARNVEPDTSELNFGLVQDGIPTSLKLILRSPYGKPLKFLRLEGDSDSKLKVASVHENNQSCELELALDSKKVKSLEVFNVRVVTESGGAVCATPIDCYVGKVGTSTVPK